MTRIRGNATRSITEKRIKDSIYGNISISGQELRLIDTPIFQRLRQIKQLGATDLVYPGATHTRFSHSIGTMHITGRFVDGAGRGRGKAAEAPDEREKFRIAALLHDLGHYPFSHTTEGAVSKVFGGMDHEQFGGYLIRKFFAERLDSYKPSEIINVFTGRRKSPLLSSALDADKADYLLRDSYNAGVPYGRVGLQRLLRTISYVKGGIVFEKDEVAVENFLIGRYHMYRAVYHHKAVVSFNLMVGKIFELLTTENYLPDPKDLIKSEDEYSLSGYTDGLVVACMHKYLETGRDRFLRSLIKLFLAREPLESIYLNPQSSRPGGIPKETAAMLALAEDPAITERIAEAAGVDAREIFAIKMRPLSLIDEDTKIYISNKGRPRSITESGGLIMNMIGSRTLYDARVYAMPGRSKAVAAALGKYLRKNL